MPKSLAGRVVALAAVLLMAAACGETTTERDDLPPLEAVARVELDRYLGDWHEIASYPQRFQEGCHNTTANYTLGEDGDIVVVNRCNKGSVDGPESVATGRARVVDPSTNAKLEVSFFGPFWGDYWIIDLGPDYEYAVVGHPGRDYLWVLSRTPTLEPAVYDGILARLSEKNYDLGRLVKTQQQ